MIPLVKSELRRILGRRGSAWGSTAIITLAAIGVLIWAFIGKHPNAHTAIHGGGGVIVVFTIFCTIIIAAIAGSYDVDNGTMRYLVLTGVPRWKIFVARPLALIPTIVLITIPGIVIVIISGFVAGGQGASADDYFTVFYTAWLGAILYGFVSLAVGTFLKSNGVAIAVSIIVNFVGAQIAFLIYDKVSKTAGNLFFTQAASTVLDRSTTDAFSIPVSALVVLAWLAVLLGLAAFRIHRAEY